MNATATTVKLLILTTLGSHAAVVLNSASIGPGFGPYPSAFMVANRDVTTGVTATTAITFTFAYASIAQGYGLFLMTAGTVLDAAYVNANPEWINNWNTPGSATLTLGNGASTFLGYWEMNPPYGGRGDPPYLLHNVAYEADLFGWAQIQNQAGTLVVTSSAHNTDGALAIGATIIPEPSCTLLALIAAAGAVWRRGVQPQKIG
ncbi:MAG: hypothetical protein V4819_05140 [Verrucomicrobiota bacterium]